MIYYIIPARKGSKGLPLKNRKLFPFTISKIPEQILQNNTFVTTNDEHIIEECKDKKIQHVLRNDFLSGDKVCIRDVMEDCVNRIGISQDDTVVLLYLTYPQRTWEMVENMKNFFIENNLDSLLCKKEPKTHPYLCFLESRDNRGIQVVSHDQYRRQDYPECFELSFYTCIFKASELDNLSKNMFNDNTYFFSLDEHLDVDTEKEFIEFMGSSNES